MSAISRHPWLIAAVAAVTVAITAAFTLTREATYRSQSDVLVATGFLSGTYGSEVLDVPRASKSQVLVTQTRLAALPAVAELTSKRLDGRFTPEEIERSVLVRGSQDVDVISITAERADPAEARLLASEYAQAVVARAEGFARHEIDRALRSINVRLGAYTTPESREGATYQRLTNDREELLLVKEGVDGGLQIAQGATRPRKLDTFSIPQLILALMAGLVLGVGAALLRSRLLQRITADDIRDRLGVPVLGRVPRRIRSLPTALSSPIAREAEAARALAITFDEASTASGVRVALVASAGRREGRSTVSAALAVALAQLGKHVVLVAADFRNPSLSELLGATANGPGLRDVLRGDARTDDAVQLLPLGLPGDGSVGLLAAGTPGDDVPATLLAQREFVNLLETLSRVADYVILDSPPALEFGEAFLLARHADGMLMVANERRSDIDALERLTEMARLSGCTVLGIAVTGPARRAIEVHSASLVRTLSTVPPPANAPGSLRPARREESPRAGGNLR